jgi:hypothetical protein
MKRKMMIRTCYLVIAALTLTTQAARADFSGFYDPGNWATSTNGQGGFVNTAGAPASISLSSPDNGTGNFGFIDYSIQVPTGGVFSFDWFYQTFDVDGDGYDSSWYINNSVFALSGTSGTFGNISVGVSAGDVIGWRMEATDSGFGPAVLTVSNFQAPVPEPSSLALLGFASAALSVRFVRRRAD